MTTPARGRRQAPILTTRSLRLGRLLAVVGGLDAYTYVSRGGVFANAQTGNVVLFALALTQGHTARVLKHVLPIFAFTVGVVLAEVLRQPPACAGSVSARAAIALETIVLIVVGLLPAAVPDQVVTIIIASMSGLQVTSFRTLEEWSYNTTITTGNVSQRRPGSRARSPRTRSRFSTEALHLTAIIASFAAGAAVGGLLTRGLHDQTIWVAAGVLLGALTLFVLDERAPRGSEDRLMPHDGNLPNTERA